MTILKAEKGRNLALGAAAVVASAVAFYLFSFLCRMGQPVAKDELHWLVAAQSLILIGKPIVYFQPENLLLHSPTLYLHSIQWAFGFFGMHDSVARLPGILSGLFALALVFMITKNALITLLYATTPAMIQGSVILENDNHMLIPAVLFLFLSFVKYHEKQEMKWAFLTVLATTLALWVRITTPLIAVGILWLFALMLKSSFKAKIVSMAATLLGIAVFALSWFVYCRVHGYPSLFLWDYTLFMFLFRTSSEGGFRFDKLLQGLVYFTFWLGPFVTAFFLSVVLKRMIDFCHQRKLGLEDAFLIGGVGIVILYTLVGGLPFGFPKYQSPGIALMMVFGGLAVKRMGNPVFPSVSFGKILLIAGTAFLIHFLTLGDPLYVLRYSLREAAVSAPAVYKGLIKMLVMKTAFYLVFFAALGVVCWKKGLIRNFLPLLIIFSIGSNLAMGILQNTSPYNTGYNYGIRGTIDSARFIRENTKPGDFVVVPSEIVYYMKLPLSYHLPERVWKNPQELTRLVADPGTTAFAYSIAINTVDQIRGISRYEPLEHLLKEEFTFRPIGSFQIWIRKKQ